MSLVLKVNGETCVSDSDPMTPLVDMLRDELGLTGAKTVCREGFCGACMVLIDGEPAVSCLTPIALAEGRDIRSIEGLSGEARPAAVQRALEAHDVVQCGMCFPGMVATLSAFLAAHPHPSRDEVRRALVGNICRCTGYERIIEAVVAEF